MNCVASFSWVATTNTNERCGRVSTRDPHHGVEMRLCQQHRPVFGSDADPCQHGLGANDTHYCYSQDQRSGRVGVCLSEDFLLDRQMVDPTLATCADGDVLVSRLDDEGNPNPTESEFAVCIPQEWHDYLCCAHFGDWHCPGEYYSKMLNQ